jgi:parvulin-like peptidyl-prolyl isomerase
MICSRRLAFRLLALSVLTSAVGCSLEERIGSIYRAKQPDLPAVALGTSSYSRSDLDRFFDGRLSEFRDPANSDKVKSNLLESFVEEKLLLYQAEQMKIEPNPQTVRSMMEKIAATGAEDSGERPDSNRETELRKEVVNNLKTQQYLHDVLLKGGSVSDEECENYYREHLDDYVKNDVVRVSEILVDNLGLAEKLRELLKAKSNKNFGDLARVYSRGASAADGGFLGSFQRGELPEEFEKAVFTLAPGSISKIVRTKYGYHIFLVQQKVRAHQQKFIEVHDQIREMLLLEREREIISRELASLMKQIPVVIHRENLGFTYVGTRYSAGEGKTQ